MAVEYTNQSRLRLKPKKNSLILPAIMTTRARTTAVHPNLHTGGLLSRSWYVDPRHTVSTESMEHMDSTCTESSVLNTSSPS